MTNTIVLVALAVVVIGALFYFATRPAPAAALPVAGGGGGGTDPGWQFASDLTRGLTSFGESIADHFDHRES